ncbi:hypothetical protein [Geopseudomonas aromaticivorans]
MRILLFYKGHYEAAVRGPEVRYLSLARELVAMGHAVELCGRSASRSTLPLGVGFVSVANLFRMALAFFRSNVIVLHGGGGIVLLVAFFSALRGARIVLDSYAPQWVELDFVLQKKPFGERVKSLARAYFNVARNALGGIVFDKVIVANQRQLDLSRGLMSLFSLTRDFGKVVVIPFGCDDFEARDKKKGRSLLNALSYSAFSESDFLIGWLGGTYGWFDLESIMRKVSEAALRNSHVKMVFFGVHEQQREDLLHFVDPLVRKNIVFLPWVEFSSRFDLWSGLDVSMVWGGRSYENDYASRTRNFDCLTIGLPIVQNRDDEWGGRLERVGAGVVVEEDSLADILVRLSESPSEVEGMRQSMSRLAPSFYWSRFADSLLAAISSPPIPGFQRILGLFGFLLLLPAILVFFVFRLLEGQKRVDDE